MRNSAVTRRGFNLWAAAALACAAVPLRAQENRNLPSQEGRRPLADMHSHYGMFLPRLFGGFDLAKHMKETGTTLLAWSIVDDSRWITRGNRGIVQGSKPYSGDLWNYFRMKLAETDGKLARWGLQKALTPADIDAAMAGEPRVLIASEAANFLEGDPSRLAIAHAAGLRHTQIVHYIHSPLGDFQTAEPSHGGLTPIGAKVVAECKRLGIVVDLAHGTSNLVDAALDASDAAMVWSHSWISPAGGSWHESGYVARSLALPVAKKIAARGGAVGLWTVRVKGDPQYPVHNTRSFADEVMHMCDLIGPEHVAFGTDMEGAGPGPILSDYADLRNVADDLARRGLPESMLEGIFIGNYARIVKQAMRGAATT